MARFSGYWTTGGAVGHQVAGYTQSHEREAATIIASCHGNNGVGSDYANLLAGTHPAANTVRIATGGAVVDGKWFINRATYDVNVPNAGAGTTRFDRVLLRADWAGFIVEVQVKTGDAVGPPALTTTSETTYEILLYIAEVTDAGVITLTDERAFAHVTPAKSSFFNSHGSDGAIYVGRVDSAGAAVRLPAAWASARISAGVYEITHNLGTLNIVFHVLSEGGRVAIGVAPGINSFRYSTQLSDGTLTDSDAMFTVIRY